MNLSPSLSPSRQEREKKEVVGQSVKWPQGGVAIPSPFRGTGTHPVGKGADEVSFFDFRKLGVCP